MTMQTNDTPQDALESSFRNLGIEHAPEVTAGALQYDLSMNGYSIVRTAEVERLARYQGQNKELVLEIKVRDGVINDLQQQLAAQAQRVRTLTDLVREYLSEHAVCAEEEEGAGCPCSTCDAARQALTAAGWSIVLTAEVERLQQQLAETHQTLIHAEQQLAAQAQRVAALERVARLIVAGNGYGSSAIAAAARQALREGE